MPKESFPIMEYGGAIHKTSPTKSNQERRSILRWTRSSSSSSNGLCASQWYDLDKGFFLTGLMVLVVRPVYRIDNLTIKRGSRVSNLIVSFRESSNFCILGIIFLGSYLFLIHVRS